MTLKQLWCLWSGKRTMPRKPPRQQCNPPRPLALPIHCFKSETRLWSEYLHHACLSAETGERLHPCNWFSVNNQLEQLTNRSHSSAVLTRQLTNARTTSLGACVTDHTFWRCKVLCMILTAIFLICCMRSSSVSMLIRLPASYTRLSSSSVQAAHNCCTFVVPWTTVCQK